MNAVLIHAQLARRQRRGNAYQYRSEWKHNQPRRAPRRDQRYRKLRAAVYAVYADRAARKW